MGFRGLKAQSNRRQNPIVCPTAGPNLAVLEVQERHGDEGSDS